MFHSSEVVKLVEDSRVNVGWLLMSDYVKLEKKHKLRLLARPLLNGRPGFRLKLLVPKGSKTRELSQLKGRPALPGQEGIVDSHVVSRLCRSRDQTLRDDGADGPATRHEPSRELMDMADCRE